MVNFWKMLITPFLFYIIQSAEIDWTDSFNLTILRGCFIFAIVCNCLLKLWLYKKINDNYDERRVRMKPTKNAMGEEVPAREVTVTEHDLEQLFATVRTFVMSILITGFMHGWYGWVMPLMFHAIHQPIMAYDSPLFQIHVMALSDSGDGNPLKRPWSASSNMWEDVVKQANMMDPRKRQAAERKAEKKKAAKKILRAR